LRGEIRLPKPKEVQVRRIMKIGGSRCISLPRSFPKGVDFAIVEAIDGEVRVKPVKIVEVA